MLDIFLKTATVSDDKRDPLRLMGDYIGESEKRSRLDNPLIRFGKRSVAFGMEREVRNVSSKFVTIITESINILGNANGSFNSFW